MDSITQMSNAVMQHENSRVEILSLMVGFLQRKGKDYTWKNFRRSASWPPDALYVAMAKAYCQVHYWKPERQRYEARSGLSWVNYDQWLDFQFYIMLFFIVLRYNETLSHAKSGTWRTVETFIQKFFDEARMIAHPSAVVSPTKRRIGICSTHIRHFQGSDFVDNSSTQASAVVHNDNCIYTPPEQGTKRLRISTSSTAPTVPDVPDHGS